ncbi:hypothetical protein GGR39_003435 [Novosphingobium fluoreni]|uniref:Uncharacterized protein n=1 Tax=Novosphingobium fluoreni TaxID=1391222 RepID=A0A7W6C4Y0_9SPHN|nr:hypothetical protein [Novosphingobium fluoreni]MBB3941754.1 hypothetical protein [Novosphingobium fluoreni]
MASSDPWYDDEPPALRELGEAQANCALALGRLGGLVSMLGSAESRLFSYALLRTTIISALAQAGFADAAFRFDAWFGGLDRGPQENASSQWSAHAIARAVVGELSNHPWEPLATAAQTVAVSARFVSDRPDHLDLAAASDAVDRAVAIVVQADRPDESPLPFKALIRLNALLAADQMFAPLEQGARMLGISGRDIAVDQPAPPTPLWAVDLALGSILTSAGILRPALPMPGAIRAEALRPAEGGRHDAIAVKALEASAVAMAGLIQDARTAASLMRARFSHLRSSARAPQVWMMLAGFAPLGLDQMTIAFGISRRGTYAVSDALTASGLAERVTEKGKVSLRATMSPTAEEPAYAAEAPALPALAIAEFDAAMAELDRLLSRSE